MLHWPSMKLPQRKCSVTETNADGPEYRDSIATDVFGGTERYKLSPPEMRYVVPLAYAVIAVPPLFSIWNVTLATPI